MKPEHEAAERTESLLQLKLTPPRQPGGQRPQVTMDEQTYPESQLNTECVCSCVALKPELIQS